MQNTPTTNKWAYAAVLFLIGAGVAIGTLTAIGIYNAGQGWLAALFCGLFCGCLGMVGIHLLLQAIIILVSAAFHLWHTKERMWGVIPVWLFIGIYGLLLIGGVVLLGIGIIAKSPICFLIGGLALTITWGTIVVLAVIGLCCLGWKKISRLRKID